MQIKPQYYAFLMTIILVFIFKSIDLYSENENNQNSIEQQIFEQVDCEEKGLDTIIQLLQTNENIDYNKRNEKGQTIFMCLILLSKNYSDMGSLYRQYGGVGEKFYKSQYDIRKQYQQFLILKLEKGVNIFTSDKDDKTVLMYASQLLLLDLIKKLVAKGVNIHKKNITNYTAFSSATSYQGPQYYERFALYVSHQEYIETFNYFLNQKADIYNKYVLSVILKDKELMQILEKRNIHILKNKFTFQTNN